MEILREVVGAVILLLGALLSFAAAVGLVRFPDVLTRMHAATKPQTLGLLLVALGTVISLWDLRALGLMVLVAALQLLTSPVSAHIVGRSAYRTHQIADETLVADDLADDLRRAGFRLTSAGEDEEEAQSPWAKPDQE